jgi:hypothetical protein
MGRLKEAVTRMGDRSIKSEDADYGRVGEVFVWADRSGRIVKVGYAVDVLYRYVMPDAK